MSTERKLSPKEEAYLKLFFPRKPTPTEVMKVKEAAAEWVELGEATDVVIEYIIAEQGEVGPFQCPFCRHEPFDTREELSKHIKSQHPKAVKESAQKIRQFQLQEDLRQRQQQAKRKAALLRLRRKNLGRR